MIASENVYRLVSYNLDGYIRLAAEIDTPIQIGESFYGPRELYKALQKNAGERAC